MVQIAAESGSAKGLERRLAILGAASKAFRDKGFHATGMRDIAAALGMTVGNLYYYFPSKEELLAFCQLQTLEALEANLARVGASGDDAPRRLACLVEDHVVCLNEGGHGSLAHLEVPALGGVAHRELIAKRDAYERGLRRIIEDGIAAGDFRRIDAGVAARAVLGAVNWTVRWFREDGRRDARAIGAEIAAQQVRGLLADGRITTGDEE